MEKHGVWVVSHERRSFPARHRSHSRVTAAPSKGPTLPMASIVLWAALLLGLSISAASPAEGPVPWVGVLGPRVTVEALRDRGVPAEAASLVALPLAEAGAGSRPRLLLAQAGAVSSPAGVSSLQAFLKSGGKLLLFGWGPYLGPERRASAPLYTLDPLLGVRVAAFSPKGSRWVQLRDPGIGTEGGWSTVVDLGDGPSSVLEA
ncbi:MAG TPA: hypothetical protein VGN26_04910 [Armatimonadota bacterium]